MAMTPPAIIVEGLSVKFDQYTALDGISFDLDENHVLGVVGPNGAGKSVLFRSILGLQPYRGSISLFSLPRADVLPVIGYVPQKMSFEPLFPATVLDVVKMGIVSDKKSQRAHKMVEKMGYQRVHIARSGVSIAARAAKALEMVGLERLRNRRIGTLSGGELQRVFVAHALIKEPLLLILDEPVSSMDVESQEAFYSIVERTNNELGITVLMSLHDLDMLKHYSSRVLCINRRVLFKGDAGEFFTNADHLKMYTQASMHDAHHDTRRLKAGAY